MSGFGIVSANDCPHRDPKSYRLFAKLPSSAGTTAGESKSFADKFASLFNDEDLVKGFTLLKTVDQETFKKRFEVKRYKFDSVFEISEIKLLIDKTQNGRELQFCEF